MRSEDVKTALSGSSLLPAGLRSGSAGRGKQLDVAVLGDASRF